MPKTARHAPSSGSTINPITTLEVPMSNAEQSAVSAVAESSASTQPSPESPSMASSIAAPMPTGAEVNPKGAGAPTASTPPARKSRRGTAGPFDPRGALKRAAALVAKLPSEPDPALQFDAEEVTTRASSLNAAKGKLADAVATQATVESEAVPAAAALELANAMVVTYLRVKVGGGKQLVRQAKKGDAFTVASALLGQLGEMKAQVPAPLVHDLTHAHQTAAPKMKARTSARTAVKEAKSAYKTSRWELAQAMSRLKASLAIHQAHARRRALGPPTVESKKGGKRAA